MVLCEEHSHNTRYVVFVVQTAHSRNLRVLRLPFCRVYIILRLYTAVIKCEKMKGSRHPKTKTSVEKSTQRPRAKRYDGMARRSVDIEHTGAQPLLLTGTDGAARILPPQQQCAYMWGSSSVRFGFRMSTPERCTGQKIRDQVR